MDFSETIKDRSDRRISFPPSTLCSSSPTLKVPTAALLHLQVMSLLAGFRLHGFDERTVQSPPVIHALNLSGYASIETHITSYIYILCMYCLVYVRGRGCYSESCRWEVLTSASQSPTMYKEKGWKWLGIGCATLSLYLERLPKAQIWYLNENHSAPASLQHAAHQAGWSGCLVHNFDAIIVSTQAVCGCIHANLSGLEFHRLPWNNPGVGPRIHRNRYHHHETTHSNLSKL